MTAQSFQCPSCGAPLITRGSAAVISCPHCLTSVIVPEELREDDSAAQWTTLLFDNFLSNDDNHWLVGTQSSDYYDPVSRVIADGRYHWEATAKRINSISRVWLGDYQVSDFHLSVNCKHIAGIRANSAWGLIFRFHDNENYSWFRMTDSKYFAVSVSEDGQWRDTVAWTRTQTVKPNGVNQLEIIARGAHHVFLINGQIVSETDDDKFHRGLVGLAIETYPVEEKVSFDFLDFTLRVAS